MSMAESEQYRKEFKYVCSPAQQAIIVAKLKNIGTLDSHTDQRGGYTIRSIYFDDYMDCCYAENEAGNDPREKWRIRSYDLSREYIVLECKQKKAGLTRKVSCQITEGELKSLTNGSFIPFDDERQILNRFLLLRRMRQFVPKIIVEYKRIPYTIGKDIRVTFDDDIFVSRDISGFFEKDIVRRRVIGKEKRIMEIKYSDELPQYVGDIISYSNMQRTTFSKYYLGRKYSL